MYGYGWAGGAGRGFGEANVIADEVEDDADPGCPIMCRVGTGEGAFECEPSISLLLPLLKSRSLIECRIPLLFLRGRSMVVIAASRSAISQDELGVEEVETETPLSCTRSGFES